LPARAIEELIDRTDRLMREIVDEAESRASGTFQDSDLPLYDVVRYHMGWVDQQFLPVTANSGKRVRPAICLLSAGAAGGDLESAIPVAAGMELLHNFTLMHDDIQDRSELRRGRPTVWQLWGESQAINAGDATFALSQLALLRVTESGIDSAATTEILAEFNKMTLRIVEGQVLDLGFERRLDITVDDYLRMISGKTAAIVEFATWAGARVAGRDRAVSSRFDEFGRLLGLGFQIRDDYLGIWGDDSTTGKQSGDDIRGRKRSLPIIMLLESTSDAEREKLLRIYQQETIEQGDVESVTEMLDEHGIAERVQRLTESYHNDALELLEEISAKNAYSAALAELAEQLVDRSR
jgi:geranylgeranyl diphosphate synthase, type I